MPINIPFCSFVGFVENFATRIFVSPALLIVTDTDASVFGSILKHFANLNSSVLLVLSCWSSAMVPASGVSCSSVSECDEDVFSEICGTE